MTTPLNGTERVRYWETSAVVAALLEHDSAASEALRSAGRWVTSALTVAEVRRMIVRASLAGRLDQDTETRVTRATLALFETCELHAVGAEILERVTRPFPREPVRTLEAIHLATVEAVTTHPPHTTVITRDHRIRDNAIALGCLVE